TAPARPPLDRTVAAAFLEPSRRRRRRTRAILIVQDGRIVAEHYAAGFDETTRLPGWSMTKSVLGALLGVLVGEGRLALTDRALMPDWQEPDPRAAITVEDMLRMRSGLTFTEDYADLTSDVIEMLFNQADAAGSRRDLRRALVARAQARTWWWHAGGRAPARRRVLCCRTRGPGSDRHPLAPAGRRSPGPVDLHRRLEPRVLPRGVARRATELSCDCAPMSCHVGALAILLRERQ